MATLTDNTELLQRIDRKLSLLLAEKKKATWVTAGVITSLTGWDWKELKKRRGNGSIQWRRVKEGSTKDIYEYNLESLSDKFLLKNQNVS